VFQAIASNESYRALELYIGGCKSPHCAGCHNPELWDAKDNNLTPTNDVYYSGIWVLGGEPLDRSVETIASYCEWVKSFVLPSQYTMLFTRYTPTTISRELQKMLFSTFDCIKFGAFDDKQLTPVSFTLPDNRVVKLASANQWIQYF
jgi:hypothetical protein